LSYGRKGFLKKKWGHMSLFFLRVQI